MKNNGGPAFPQTEEQNTEEVDVLRAQILGEKENKSIIL